MRPERRGRRRAGATAARRSLLAAAVLSVSLATSGCGEQASTVPAGVPPQGPVVSGTLSYRERLALTDRAVAEIKLEDTSRQDAPAEVLAIQRITNPGQVPIRFELPFDPTDIDPRSAYSVRARIEDRGRLMFVSDTPGSVLTRGAGREVHLVLNQVPEAPAESTTLRGMFRYFADAARFRDCSTDRAYPVAMEGAYQELEQAYLDSGIEPGSELLVELEGHYLERLGVDANDNEINLIVDIFDKILPDKSCASGQDDGQ
jgi:putative lipoprotein